MTVAPSPVDEDEATADRGRRVTWRRRVLVGIAVLAGVAVLYVGLTFVQVWQASRQDHAGKAEAIVVLGAAQYNGNASPALRQRLDHALALYEEGVAPVIVVTGGRQEGDRFTEATTGYNYLRDRGVPDEAIRKGVQGSTTYESLAATARFLRDEDISDVVLVSSPGHARRIGEIADDVGLEASVSPSAGSASLQTLLRETAAVSVGRLVGFRRLDRLDS